MGETAKLMQTFRTAYENGSSGASIANRGDQPILGMIGMAIPVEVVIAAGFTPRLIVADRSRPTPTAEIYIEPVVPPEVHAYFEAAMNGEFNSFDLLVIARQYDKLFYYLKEVQRLGLCPSLPPLHMFDLLQSRRSEVGEYNKKNLEALVDRIGRVAGSEVTDEALLRSFETTNEVRALQRTLIERRWQGALGGVDAMQIIGAGYFMEPGAYAAALDRYLNIPPAGITAEKRYIVIGSEPLSNTQLHQIVEETGGVIVVENDSWGARAPGEDISLESDPIDALLEKYWMQSATSDVYPPQARENWFMEQAQRGGIDGVIFYVPPSDRQFGWDYPRLKVELEAKSLPTLLLRHDANSTAGRDAIRAELSAFAAGRAKSENAHV